MGQNNLFRNNHSLLGLLDLPEVWWFGKMSVFCLPGHLSAHLSPDIHVLDFFDFFFSGQKNIKIKAHICWKRHNKNWTLRFLENFFYLNLLEFNWTLRFLIKCLYIQQSFWFWNIFEIFSTNHNAAFSKLWYSWNNGAVKLIFFLWLDTFRGNQLI